MSETPIGDAIARDLARPLRRRRLIRRHRDALELADIDAWYGPLHAPSSTDEMDGAA